MKILTKSQIKLLETLVRGNQIYVKNLMSYYLKKQGYKTIRNTTDFVMAEGNIPIALVAHMDTFFEGYKADRELYYDQEKNVMFCPDGAGFDDKAGLFAIITLLSKGLRPHIILTTDEEVGGIGASFVAEEKPFEDLRYIIELDRRGKNDCVFYDCANEDFNKYVEGFGFKTSRGSFSDISIICPAWGVAGVNLSIGYQNEHTKSEILDVAAMFATIERVAKMLKEKDIPSFKYVNSYIVTAKRDMTCGNCGKTIKSFEPYMYVWAAADKIAPVCATCINHPSIEWCHHCIEPFIKTDPTDVICPKCKEELNV